MSLRVNVGCGSTPTPGWVNFDNSITVRLARWEWTWSLLQVIGLFGKHQLEFARVAVEQGVRWADAARSIPLESASVEVLYSSHMLEHLDREGARRFLQEARRVLRPGGTVRIAVPDLRLLVERYVADGDADRFIGDSLLAVPARRRAIERIAFALLGKRHHLWMYDGASLKKLLEANGFANAAVLPAGVTTISNPEPLNLSERAEESVFVEAVRACSNKSGSRQPLLPTASWRFRMRSFRHWTPRYIRDRVAEICYRAVNPDSPWLTPCAIQVLDSFLKPTDVGLEFGSGRSTVWFAKRIKHLTSIEHDEAWFARVGQLLSLQQRTNVDYRFVRMDTPEEQADRSAYVGVLERFARESLDFVLIDGVYRDFCALGAIPVLRPGGALIVDNVNWYLPNQSIAPTSRTIAQGPKGNTWSRVFEGLAGWRVIWTTSGVTDTAMFIKPCRSG